MFANAAVATSMHPGHRSTHCDEADQALRGDAAAALRESLQAWCQQGYLHHVSMRRDEDGTPLTARRFLAIAQPGGDDDYFSAGFSEEERQVCAVRLVAI